MSYVPFEFDAQYSFAVAEGAAHANWPGISIRNAESPEIDWGGNEVPDLATINAACAIFVSAGGIDNQANLNERALAIDLLGNGGENGKFLRGLMLLVRTELNLHAARTNAILDAVDAATTLANLKSAVALIVNLPIRSKSDLVSAIQNIINIGDAD